MQLAEVDPVQKRLDEGLLGNWYVVAKSVDVKHDRPVAVKALNRELVLWRGADGKVRCVADYCPHRAARLSLGRTVGDSISCRYHGVTVDGTGTIISVPGMADCALEGRRAVDAYAVEEAADGIFVYFPSTIAPEPPPLPLPKELIDASFTHFLCMAPWGVNHRYVLDNLVDPMHGIFLHSDTFTLGRGVQQDLVEINETPTGFIVKRVAQQQVNFDWAEIIIDRAALYGRVLISYPPAAGPGGPMFVITFVTPIDKDNCRIFFWRTRMVSTALERETWRFLFRARLETRHWHVLEQDRNMLEEMPADARNREMLYQHDLGVARLRKIMRETAAAQIKAEAAAPPQPQRRRQAS